MSGAALAPILGANYGTDRRAYHLTADYNWGYTTEEAVRTSTEEMGWETVAAVKHLCHKLIFLRMLPRCRLLALTF